MPIVPRSYSATECAGNAVKRTPENKAPTSFHQWCEQVPKPVVAPEESVSAILTAFMGGPQSS
jgi:hypothetical protein